MKNSQTRPLLSFIVAFSMCFVAMTRFARAEQQYTVVAVPPKQALVPDGRLSAGWLEGSHVTLAHDITYRKGLAGDTTDVYVLADSQYLYVAFHCVQKQPLTVTQHTNDVGEGSDDEVSVGLWPSGPNGFAYTFTSTPNGTHYQTSSENTGFSPPWDSNGRVAPDGFDVTMRIPMRVLHGDGRANWRLQFVRYVYRNNMTLVWAYNPVMTYPFDAIHSGTLLGIGNVGSPKTSKPEPRVGIYGLGEIASPDLGGNTSRVGLDFSVPIARSSAFFGALHPDYSEVEIDQQTIAPTIFKRQYTEVRPFFTQSANYFLQTSFYTPYIPTPSSGFAVEGTPGDFKFAALDAIGQDGRNDDAEMFAFTSPGQNWFFREQRVGVTLPGAYDLTQSTFLSYDDTKHWDVVGSFSKESGSAVANGAGNYASGAVSWRDPTTTASLSLFNIGTQFSPFDGYVPYNGTAGYQAYATQTWKYSAQSSLQSLALTGSVDVSHAPDGLVNYNAHSVTGNITTHNNNEIVLSTGSLYVDEPSVGLVPFNQNEIGFALGSDPNKGVGVDYTLGAIYDGYAQNLDINAFAQVFQRGTLSVEQYSTHFNSPLVGHQTQVLNRASYTFQFTKTDAFSIGLRGISGAPPGIGPQPAVHATNFSFAYAQHRARTNLFIVYGDPNALSTAHSFIVKFVQFLGAGQGS